ATLTMRPPSGPNLRSAARQTRKQLRRLVEIICSNVSTGVSRTGRPPSQPPAQLTTAQIGASPSNPASTDRSSVRSPARSSALREIPPLPLGLLRFCGASACLAALLFRLRPSGKRMPPRAVWGKLFWLSLLAVPVNQGFFLTGLALSTAAHAALLYTLTPVF